MLRKLNIKFWSLFCLIIVIVAIGCSVCVFAEDIIDVNINDGIINVSYKTNVKKTHTLKVYELNYDEENEIYEITGFPKMLLEESNYIVESELMNYKFDSFSMVGAGGTEAETGYYRVVIDNKIPKDFKYVSKLDIVKIFNDLNEASSEEVESIMKRAFEFEIFSDFSTKYLEYSQTNIGSNIDARLSSLSWDMFTDDSTYDDINGAKLIVATELNKCFTLAELVSASDINSFQNNIIQGESLFGLDLHYYNDEELSLDASTLMNIFKSVTASVELEEESIKKAFDEATLITIIKTSDFGTIADALGYYDDRCIELEGNFSSMNDTKKNQIAIEIRKLSSYINTADDVEKEYENVIDALNTSNNTNSRPTGGGNGGGSGGRGGSSVGIVFNTPVEVDKEHKIVDALPENKKENAIFTDVEGDFWGAKSINELSKLGVIHGKDTNKFCPNDNITRQEVIKIVIGTFDMYDENASCFFEDVKEDMWSYKYVASGVEKGIISGVSEEEFLPEQPISREDMAVIMYRVAKNKDYRLKPANSEFIDTEDISDYAKNAVNSLKATGLVSGVGGNRYNPKSLLTRAEAVQIIYNLLTAMEGE